MSLNDQCDETKQSIPFEEQALQNDHNKNQKEELHQIQNAQKAPSQYLDSFSDKQFEGSIISSYIASSIGNTKSYNNKLLSSLLGSEVLYEYTDDEGDNKGKSQNKKIDVIKEEEQINNPDIDGDIIEVPIYNQLRQSLTYDALIIKCQNLEEYQKYQTIKYDQALKQIQNLIEKNKKFEEQEKNLISALDQNVEEIQNLKEKNQEFESQLEILKKKNNAYEQTIQSQEEKLKMTQNQFDEQIIQNQQQKSELEKLKKENLINFKNFQEKCNQNLKFQMKKLVESQADLKLKEKLKIKEQIILYLENELAESNLRFKQEGCQKTKLHTLYDQQKTINSMVKLDKQLPKPQTPKTQQFSPKDAQRLVQSQVNFKQENKNSSLIVYISEKIKMDQKVQIVRKGRTNHLAI